MFGVDFVVGFIYANALKPRYENDFADRANYLWTVRLLLMSALILGAKQYCGQPIQCFVPAFYRGVWEQYTENYCFIENTYFVPFNDQIEDNPNNRYRRQLNYYQWVPLVLVLQALLFYLPNLVWKLLNYYPGMQINEIVRMASELAINPANQERDIQIIAAHLTDCENVAKAYAKTSNKLTWLRTFGRPKGVYVTLLYIFVKLLFILNLIGQFFLMNHFLGLPYSFWGAEIMLDLIKGYAWRDSGHFPRVTYCDMAIRDQGGAHNIHLYTIQCVIMVNLFNERAYIFIWWWFVALAVVTIGSLVWWLWNLSLHVNRVRFVRSYLPFEDQQANRQLLNRFCRSLLKPDGVLALHMLSANAGDMVTIYIVREMWRDYKTRDTLNSIDPIPEYLPKVSELEMQKKPLLVSSF